MINHISSWIHLKRDVLTPQKCGNHYFMWISTIRICNSPSGTCGPDPEVDTFHPGFTTTLISFKQGSARGSGGGTRGSSSPFQPKPRLFGSEKISQGVRWCSPQNHTESHWTAFPPLKELQAKKWRQRQLDCVELTSSKTDSILLLDEPILSQLSQRGVGPLNASLPPIRKKHITYSETEGERNAAGLKFSQNSNAPEQWQSELGLFCLEKRRLWGLPRELERGFGKGPGVPR